MERFSRIGPWILVFVLGVGGGLGLSAVAGDDDDDPEPSPTPRATPSRPLLDEDEVVVFRAAEDEFPVQGAAFTEPVDIGPDEGCDKTKLVDALNDDSRRERAWLRVLEVDEGDLEPFVERLVHGVLTEPLAQTEHGCLGSGACPFAIHSVLGSGTIVLVDPEAEFEPVVRCRSGTPLTPPECPPNCLPAPTEESPTPTPEDDEDGVTTSRGIRRSTVTPTPVPTSAPTPTPAPTPAPTPTPDSGGSPTGTAQT